MKTKNELCFCYCFDENFNKQAFTSMISLLDYVSENIKIKIIHNTENLKTQIPIKILNHERLHSIESIQFKENNYSFPNLNNSHVSEATYYRLFLSKYISNEEIIIYIDADTVAINDPISYIRKKIELLNNSKYSIAAYTEHTYDRLSQDHVNNKNSYPKRLHMDSNYFNAGVMIVDIKYWQDTNLHEKFIKNMKKLDQNIVQWDQDVLNSTFNGEYVELDKSINYFNNHYSKDSEEIVYLIHFLGSKKPWLTSGAFFDGSLYYHTNYRKIYNQDFHIEHKWKYASVAELLKSIINKNFFRLDYPTKYLLGIIKSLLKFN